MPLPGSPRATLAFSRLLLRSRTISSAARQARTASSPAPAQAWPWRRVAQSPGAQTIREERRIYARPASVNARMLWLVVGIWTPLCFFTADNIRFSAERQAIKEAQARAEGFDSSSPVTAPPSVPPPSTSNPISITAERISHTLDPLASTHSTKDSLVAGVLLTAGLVLPFVVIAWPTRPVTRLTQVRLLPLAHAAGGEPAAAKPKEYIQVETISQAMWRGPWGRPRLVPREDVHVTRIRSGKEMSDTPYLKLTLTPPPSERSFLDKWSYRINFMPVRETDYTAPLKDGSLPEVVVSLRRMEEVFGRLRS